MNIGNMKAKIIAYAAILAISMQFHMAAQDKIDNQQFIFPAENEEYGVLYKKTITRQCALNCRCRPTV